MAGYVRATSEGYVLERKALKLLALSSSRPGKITTPVPITMIAVNNTHGETLLLNRNVRPFRGWYGLPSGVIHAGESPQQAARRELYEKTGIEAAQPLHPAGVLDFSYSQHITNDIFVHAIAFIFTYVFTGEIDELMDKKSNYGQLSWSKFGRDNILPEAYAARDIIKEDAFVHQSHAFLEPSHELDGLLL